MLRERHFPFSGRYLPYIYSAFCRDRVVKLFSQRNYPLILHDTLPVLHKTT